MCYVTDALLASSGGLMRDRHYQDTSLSGMREMKREREGGVCRGGNHHVHVQPQREGIKAQTNRGALL